MLNLRLLPTNKGSAPDCCSCAVCGWSGKITECNSYEESENWENPEVYTVDECPKCEDGGIIDDYHFCNN